MKPRVSEARRGVLSRLVAPYVDVKDAMANLATALSVGDRDGLAKSVAQDVDTLELLVKLGRTLDGRKLLVTRETQGLKVLGALTLGVEVYNREGRGTKALWSSLTTIVRSLWGQERWSTLVFAIKAIGASLVAFAASKVAPALFAGVVGQVVGIVGIFAAWGLLIVAAVALRGLRAAKDERSLPGARTPLARATRALNIIERLVDKRIADEEIGDAAEGILRMVEQGRPPRHIYLKVVTTIFWVLVHALRASGLRVVAGTIRKKNE